MKKIHIVSLALVAIFALSAMLAATASAETTLLAEWLVGGAGVTTATSTESTGTLLLEDSKFKGSLECKGILDGTVNTNGADETTEVLNEAGTVKIALGGTALVCIKEAGSSCEGTDNEVFPEDLPWKTLLYLTEGGLFGDHVFKAGYSVTCLILGIGATDECVTEEGLYELLNVTGGVEGNGTISPDGTCTFSKEATGVVQFITGNLTKTLTGTLSASE